MLDIQNSLSTGYFASRFTHDPVRNKVWHHITRYLEPFWGLGSSATALELGTGYGSWIRSVQAHRREAIDINPDLPRIFEAQGIRGIKTHVGSCVDLSPWDHSSLDLILASNLLEHLSLDDALRCVSEVTRILKPGGTFCIVQPNFPLCYRKYFDDFTHRTIFSDTSLADLFQASGLKVDRIWRRFMPLTMKDSKASKMTFLVPLYLKSPIKPFAGQMCIIARKPLVKR